MHFPLGAFGRDEQVVLQNFFRKYSRSKTAAQIYAMRVQHHGCFATLCDALKGEYLTHPCDTVSYTHLTLPTKA